MVMIDIDYFDRDTELGIAMSRSGVAKAEA